jgi:tRNA G10  N-methylase Trm11
MSIIKSVYDNQNDILTSIQSLYCSEIEVDLTYGNGAFYKNIPQPKIKFDIDPLFPDVTKASSINLPLENESINSCIFDPPFLTYVRQGREGNGNMIMSNRFSGYWKYSELQEHYIGTLKEVSRILKPKGFLIFKCQDIIHNHKMHCTHANVIEWAKEHNLFLVDLFVLVASHRLPSPNRKGKQQHARIFHSYFLVFGKNK